MNKTQSTIIDPNFSRNIPANKGRVPNALSEKLPEETLRNYFDRFCEEYNKNNQHIF